jgi:hypothetical protein
MIGSLVASQAKITKKIYTLNPISLSFAGLPKYEIVPQNLVLNAIAGPGGLPMACITFGTSVAPA